LKVNALDSSLTMCSKACSQASGHERRNPRTGYHGGTGSVIWRPVFVLEVSCSAVGDGEDGREESLCQLS
jgi:hypothetical protein